MIGYTLNLRYNLAQGKHIQGKQNGTEDRPLRHLIWEWSRWWQKITIETKDRLFDRYEKNSSTFAYIWSKSVDEGMWPVVWNAELTSRRTKMECSPLSECIRRSIVTLNKAVSVLCFCLTCWLKFIKTWGSWSATILFQDVLDKWSFWIWPKIIQIWLIKTGLFKSVWIQAV